jgi:REP element-mobilizing transposase RayT
MSYNNLRKGRQAIAGQAYHLTAVTQNRFPFFTDLSAGRLLVRQLITLQADGLAETLCYVIMPDHLHWLMLLRSPSLSPVMQRLKGRTARAIGKPIWQPNYYDHAIRADEDLRATARYIVANPIRAGLVDQIGEYPLWDALWLDEALSG